MLILWALQQTGHIHMELLREPNFFYLPQTAWNVLLDTSCLHVPPHRSRYPPAPSLAWPQVPHFQSFPAIRQGDTVTLPPQRRWGLVAHQYSSRAEVEAEQRATLSIEGVFFLFSSPANCLTHQSLTQGAFCSLSFILEDVVEGWKKASGSAVVLTDDICNLASISSIHP